MRISVITRQNIGRALFATLDFLLLCAAPCRLGAQSFSDHHFLPFQPEQFQLLAREYEPAAVDQRIESCKLGGSDTSAASRQHNKGNPAFNPKGPLPVLEWARERSDNCATRLDQPLESLNPINQCPSSNILDPIVLCGISQTYLVRPSSDDIFLSSFNRYPILSTPVASLAKASAGGQRSSNPLNFFSLSMGFDWRLIPARGTSFFISPSGLTI